MKLEFYSLALSLSIFGVLHTSSESTTSAAWEELPRPPTEMRFDNHPFARGLAAQGEDMGYLFKEIDQLKGRLGMAEDRQKSQEERLNQLERLLTEKKPEAYFQSLEEAQIASQTRLRLYTLEVSMARLDRQLRKLQTAPVIVTTSMSPSSDLFKAQEPATKGRFAEAPMPPTPTFNPEMETAGSSSGLPSDSPSESGVDTNPHMYQGPGMPLYKDPVPSPIVRHPAPWPRSGNSSVPNLHRLPPDQRVNQPAWQLIMPPPPLYPMKPGRIPDGISTHRGSANLSPAPGLSRYPSGILTPSPAGSPPLPPPGFFHHHSYPHPQAIYAFYPQTQSSP